MEILKLISLVLCIVSGGGTAYLYFKLRRVLRDNSEDELETVSPEIVRILNRFYVALVCLIFALALSIIPALAELIGLVR